MKNYFKKTNLLMGTIATVIGLGFMINHNSQATENSIANNCEWVDKPGQWYDGCVIQVIARPCLCETC